MSGTGYSDELIMCALVCVVVKGMLNLAWPGFSRGFDSSRQARSAAWRLITESVIPQ